MPDNFDELRNKKEKSKLGAVQDKIDIQHKKGKLTARERIELLVDEGSFEETDMFVKHRAVDFGLNSQHYAGDGVITGFAKIETGMLLCIARTLLYLGARYLKVMRKK